MKKDTKEMFQVIGFAIFLFGLILFLCFLFSDAIKFVKGSLHNQNQKTEQIIEQTKIMGDSLASRVPRLTVVLPNGSSFQFWSANTYHDTSWVCENGNIETVKCYGDTIKFTVSKPNPTPKYVPVRVFHPKPVYIKTQPQVITYEHQPDSPAKSNIPNNIILGQNVVHAYDNSIPAIDGKLLTQWNNKFNIQCDTMIGQIKVENIKYDTIPVSLLVSDINEDQVYAIQGYMVKKKYTYWKGFAQQKTEIISYLNCAKKPLKKTTRVWIATQFNN